LHGPGGWGFGSITPTIQKPPGKGVAGGVLLLFYQRGGGRGVFRAQGLSAPRGSKFGGDQVEGGQSPLTSWAFWQGGFTPPKFSAPFVGCSNYHKDSTRMFTTKKNQFFHDDSKGGISTYAGKKKKKKNKKKKQKKKQKHKTKKTKKRGAADSFLRALKGREHLLPPPSFLPQGKPKFSEL